jgi:tetratricopeptide (TPR) repeat protein
VTPTFAKLRPARTLCAATLVLLMLSGCSQAGSPRDRTPPTATADSREHLAKQPPRQAEVTGRASSYGDYLAGLYANKQRDLSAAADYMARALEEDPKNPALLHQTFVLMVSEGRMDEARALAERLVALRPQHGPATVLLALENMRDGNPARADQLLTRLSERGLAALVRPLLGSWIELALGDRTAALERLDELRAVDGFDMLHSLHVGLINDVGGAGDVAAEAYAQSLSRVDSPSLRLTWLIGNFHERRGERDEAAALYRRFLADDPGSTVMQDVLRAMETRGSTPPEPMVRTPRDGLAEALFNLSGLLEQQNAGDLGLVYARYALHVRPDYAVARMLVGEILQSQNRHRDAIAVYREVDASSPFHYVARLRVAEALEALERVCEVMAPLEYSAGQHSARYEPLYRLGNLLRTRERFAEADAAYGRARKGGESAEQRQRPR